MRVAFVVANGDGRHASDVSMTQKTTDWQQEEKKKQEGEQADRGKGKEGTQKQESDLYDVYTSG